VFLCAHSDSDGRDQCDVSVRACTREHVYDGRSLAEGQVGQFAKLSYERRLRATADSSSPQEAERAREW
jgi:hypothetical protein